MLNFQLDTNPFLTNFLYLVKLKFSVRKTVGQCVTYFDPYVDCSNISFKEN